MVEWTTLQINLLSATYTMIGIIFARWLWRKEIKKAKLSK